MAARGTLSPLAAAAVGAGLYTGTSGWQNYARELEFYTHTLNSLEFNSTFYSLMSPKTFASWRDAAPAGFKFALKGFKLITHIKKLLNVDEALATFFDQGLLQLGDKLGPILWQLPPKLAYNGPRIALFLALLPKTLGEAARLAKGYNREHLGKKNRGAVTTLPAGVDPDTPIHHPRHKSFKSGEFFELLRAHDVACCVSESAGEEWPCFDRIDTSSSLVYVRLHGNATTYKSGYTPAELDAWAGVARDVTAGALGGAARACWVLFDNPKWGLAPFDALGLAQRVCGGAAPDSGAVLQALGVSRTGRVVESSLAGDPPQPPRQAVPLASQPCTRVRSFLGPAGPAAAARDKPAAASAEKLVTGAARDAAAGPNGKGPGRTPRGAAAPAGSARGRGGRGGGRGRGRVGRGGAAGGGGGRASAGLGDHQLGLDDADDSSGDDGGDSDDAGSDGEWSGEEEGARAGAPRRRPPPKQRQRRRQQSESEDEEGADGEGGDDEGGGGRGAAKRAKR
ncbi:hypothetical protein Rsub_06200 [Raphidocelis subcapitata]|uniref:DUF72 domain-containing protein n=1 Tax=Raphidocelis subcapitata TaxID=307507 RepID=A0A2V0P246_9CHLO|nr:hypothetical protein Rsub_06200 [Raphidocelis subcapitata]|eukprot:GBF93951.1 hypothetical protein Rsub_06200 [Raphidocelis subcapitata]